MTHCERRRQLSTNSLAPMRRVQLSPILRVCVNGRPFSQSQHAHGEASAATQANSQHFGERQAPDKCRTTCTQTQQHAGKTLCAFAACKQHTMHDLLPAITLTAARLHRHSYSPLPVRHRRRQCNDTHSYGWPSPTHPDAHMPAQGIQPGHAALRQEHPG